MVEVGTVLHGFCNGYFGRDSYGDKVIEAIGEDWVVVREIDTNRPVFTEFIEGSQKNRMVGMLQAWSRGRSYYDNGD